MINAVVVSTCYGCGRPFSFCPDCVTGVSVDPETNRPPDVDTQARPCTPDPAALARSVRRVVCVSCVERSNARRTPETRQETETELHARHVGTNYPSQGMD